MTITCGDAVPVCVAYRAEQTIQMTTHHFQQSEKQIIVTAQLLKATILRKAEKHFPSC